MSSLSGPRSRPRPLLGRRSARSSRDGFDEPVATAEITGAGTDRPTAAAADDRIGELWSALNGDQAGLEITDHHAEQTR